MSQHQQDVTQRYDAFGKNAYSTADNPWAAFFGTPAAPWKTTSYDKYDRHNWNLPEAYVGKNLTLAQTIDEIIYTDETYYTTALLPFNFTDQLSVQWDRWEFNEHFTGIVPEQGVSRLVSSHRESRTESFVRRGLAAIFEHGFMGTPQGRANYFLTLAQIARAVQETINFGVIYAFLTCGNYNRTWEERHGYFRKSTLKELLERENFMWAIAVKTEFGMEKLDAKIVEWMNRFRTTADTWVLPPAPAMYLRLVPAEKVYHYLAGDEGPRRVNDVVGAGRPHENNAPGKRLHDIVEPYALFKRNKVYLTRTYHVDRTGPIDLMTRVSSVGEYFKIINNTSDCDFKNGYQTCYTDTRIYNEEDDAGYTVRIGEALQHCMVFDEEGKPRVPTDNRNAMDAKDMSGVFFLRNVPDPMTGADTFLPIEYLGDIDPQFFNAHDAVNLGYTAAAAAFPDKRDRIDIERKLNAGMQLIHQWSMMPLGVNNNALAGATTWAALTEIAGGEGDNAATITAFQGAVTQVATALGSLMGSARNIFLDPANELPGGAQSGSPAAVLYENLLNYNSVPVFTLVDVAGGAGVPEDVAMVEGPFGFLKEAFLVADTPEFDSRGLSVDEKATLAAITARMGAGGNLNAVNTPNYETIKGLLLGNPRLSKGRDLGALRDWVDQVDRAKQQAFARADAALQRAGAGATLQFQRRAGTATNLAVNPNNPSVLDGSARAAGYALASRFDITKARDATEAQVVRGGVPISRPTIIGNFAPLEETPIMRGLITAQAANINAGSDYNIGASIGGRGGASAFAALDDYDMEPVGAMQNLDYGQVAANRGWVPRAGGQLGAQPVNLRFGTMGLNLSRVSAFAAAPLAKLAAALYYGSPWEMATLDGFQANNVLSPFNMLGFRIGMYDMALGIKCKAGSETGYTYFSHSDFQLADDATIKIHYGNYTHYGKSVIHRPENVFIAYDIFPNRCLGGMGVLPYTDPSEYDPEDAVYSADIWYVMVPFRDTRFSRVIDMAGRFYSYMDKGMLDAEDPANRKLHYTTAPYYNRIWNWYDEGDVVEELDEPMFRMNNPNKIRTVWQGAQGTYNPVTKKHDKDIIRNKSPWGTTAEGSKASRDGRMERVPTVAHGVLGF